MAWAFLSTWSTHHINMKSKLEVFYRPTNDLIPYAKNSRTHSENQIAQIAASIKEFGFTNPVLTDEDGGIIAGHGRVVAAKKLNIDSIPTIVLSGLTATQRKAYIIADNNIPLNAGWDEELLSMEIAALNDDGFDLELIGFNNSEIESLINKNSGHDGQVLEDNYSGEYVHRVSFGDIWDLGGNRLMCGDSSNIENIELLLSGINPDVLIYDPPYEIDDAWGYYYPCEKAIVFCDYKYLQKAMKICQAYSENYQFIWDNCTSWYTPNRPLARHKSAIFCSNDKFWDFDAAIYQDGKDRKQKTVSNTRGDCEYTPLDNGFVHLQTVYQEPNVSQDSAHAHSKPVKWLNALMRGSGGKVFLDLFAGSGAAIIAAPETATVYSMEIDQFNCDRILARYEESTGLTALKL